MLEQLQAFRSGARENPMMSIVAKDLTDNDIDNLIAYYSSIPVTVGKLPATDEKATPRPRAGCLI